MISKEYLNAYKSELYNLKGRITDIERYAINDGFGVRTTVFLKGCPLRCKWCSNPETQKFYKEMVFFEDKCINCGMCIKMCKYRAIKENMQADRGICDTCHEKEEAFLCAEKCYPECRKVVGDLMSVDDVYQIVKRDMSFYELSGGGVTLSGGEPLSQPEFIFALLKTLTENWINTAIETCGAGKKEDYEKIAPYLNFVFMDLKSINKEKHIAWTGVTNEHIKENIILMDKLSKKYNFDLIIRTPIIPGFNDQDQDIHEIGQFIKSNLINYKGAELLPYHKLGRGKYMSLEREYELVDLTIPSDLRMQELNKILLDVEIPMYQF